MTNEKPQSKTTEELIGEITHYFGKIGVAVIDLSHPLKAGDMIRVVDGETNFTQTVTSMQVDHINVAEAKAGSSVGLKIDQKAKEGYKVYKV